MSLTHTGQARAVRCPHDSQSQPDHLTAPLGLSLALRRSEVWAPSWTGRAQSLRCAGTMSWSCRVALVLPLELESGGGTGSAESA